MIFLDTHVLVWLYAGLLENIPEKIQNHLETADLFISPMVELELNFLNEIGRITVKGQDIVRHLDAHIGITISRIDFYRIVEEAQEQSWTRDPFDRLIVANASVFQAPLITKDERIRQNYSLSIW
jgi:PIN domain nuclease of toxin-antitoxin system